ncbi:MAG: RluA family pseudouridine synthase [Sideroxydans sp.]|nr:RluA family pseudouridine synthase [Sideroxydans sp.]
MIFPAPELLFADDYLLVAVKPAGLLSVPGRGPDKQDCLSERVRSLFPDALIVHRLDMATSGLMLFARGSEMQRKLSMLFQHRKIDKRYIAVCAGKLDYPQGEINLPIAPDWPNRPLQRIDPEHGKHSLTRYRLLKMEGDHSRVELEPVTGRSHQLRLHLASVGNPILGDALYGDEHSAARLLLHACMLRFHHPCHGEMLTFEHSPSF